MKKFNLEKKPLSKIQTEFETQVEGLRNGGKPLVITVVLTFIVMILVCLAVFFFSVRGAEKVMVPNVRGKTLVTALLEMQAKELYPKISLRYSDDGAAGTVLDQNPEPGAIVKAYRRVTLTVSRGIPLDTMADFTGKTLAEVQSILQTAFAGERALLRIAEPVYKTDSLPAGTIIAQYPQAGEMLLDNVDVLFIVSSGSTPETVQVPSLIGLDAQRVYELLENNKITVDFTFHEAAADERGGAVTSQSEAEDSTVTAYSRIQADFALTPRWSSDGAVTGIFQCALQEYPYPVPVALTAQYENGTIRTLAAFNHPGGKFTIPYELPLGTILTLSVLGDEQALLAVE